MVMLTVIVTAAGFASISNKVKKGYVNAFQLTEVGAYAEGSVQTTVTWSADAACLMFIYASDWTHRHTAVSRRTTADPHLQP